MRIRDRSSDVCSSDLAAEILSPDAPANHWDQVEGQGSICNPAYAAVSLGLLHGSQPDVFVVCHDPARKVILGMESFALPSIQEVIGRALVRERGCQYVWI